MSRAAVFDALLGDATLNGMVNPANVLVNYNFEGRPNNLQSGPFLVLRWGSMLPRGVMFEGGSKGPRLLTIWAHWPEEKTTDFVRLDKILDRVRKILTPLEDIIGGDGYRLTNVKFVGASEDMKDPGFKTITRNAAFEVLGSSAT